MTCQMCLGVLRAKNFVVPQVPNILMCLTRPTCLKILASLRALRDIRVKKIDAHYVLYTRKKLTCHTFHSHQEKFQRALRAQRSVGDKRVTLHTRPTCQKNFHAIHAKAIFRVIFSCPIRAKKVTLHKRPTTNSSCPA